CFMRGAPLRAAAVPDCPPLRNVTLSVKKRTPLRGNSGVTKPHTCAELVRRLAAQFARVHDEPAFASANAAVLGVGDGCFGGCFGHVQAAIVESGRPRIPGGGMPTKPQ